MISSRRYLYVARVALDEGGDPRAPGAAVTMALCGHWEHEGECRFPHLTAVDGAGDELSLRVRFDCRPEEETAVRRLIRDALAGGRLDGPDGTTTWRV